MDDLYISVDIETIGLIVGDYSLASIGACVVGNQTNSQFYAELKPINDNVREKSVEVCGLTLEYLKEHGQDPTVTMKQFADWLAHLNRRPIFVGFNAPFDYAFVNYYFLKYLGYNPFGINALDIKPYYMGMMKCGWRETTKKKILPQFKSHRKHTHNALDDAIEQADLFENMLKYNGVNLK